MDLRFSEEHTELRKTLARLLEERAPLASVRAVEATEQGFDPALHRTLAELGVLGVSIPEALGGGGGGLFELSLVALELGAAALPGPFFSSVVECGLLLSALPEGDPRRELLRGVAEGTTRLSLARYEADAGESEAAIGMVARPEDGAYVLEGRKLFVRDAEGADVLLVVARTEEGTSLFRVDRGAEGLSVRRMPSLARERLAEVRFEKVRVPAEARLGDEGQGYRLLEDAQLRAAIVKSAEMIGGMRTCLRLTSQHLLERIQYGKAIGTFQALQHDAADMLTQLESCERYLHRVASLVDHGEPLEPSASMLKAFTSEAYRFVTERSVQLHGAIGTTCEHPISIFYQRSKAAETALGSAQSHYERVAKALGL